MLRNDLLQKDGVIFRVLDVTEDRILVIDCVKRTMPQWIDVATISQYQPATEDDLLEQSEVELFDIDSLDAESKRTVHERFTDKGSEYKSTNFEQIAELGVTVVNLPSYRPELKGSVEKFFDLVQGSYKPYLRGKGVIEPDYQERGAHDYRKDACLTLEAFETIIIHCIVYYNSQRIIENFPYTQEMLSANIPPHSSDIWNWNMFQPGANLIYVSKEQLLLTLLPRTTGTFFRHGLKVNKLRYYCAGFTEELLKGGTVTVAYNPEDVSMVWVLMNGTYTKFDLIETRFCYKQRYACFCWHKIYK